MDACARAARLCYSHFVLGIFQASVRNEESGRSARCRHCARLFEKKKNPAHHDIDTVRSGWKVGGGRGVALANQNVVLRRSVSQREDVFFCAV